MTKNVTLALLTIALLTCGCDKKKCLNPGDFHDAAFELFFKRMPAPKFDGYVEIKDGVMVPVEHRHVVK